MKNILIVIYKYFFYFLRETRGSSSSHRTNSKSIKLYRVNKNMSDTIESNYNEVEINKTLYRVTGIFTGETELKNTLENLIIKQVLQSGVNYGKIKL